MEGNVRLVGALSRHSAVHLQRSKDRVMANPPTDGSSARAVQAIDVLSHERDEPTSSSARMMPGKEQAIA